MGRPAHLIKQAPQRLNSTEPGTGRQSAAACGPDETQHPPLSLGPRKQLCRSVVKVGGVTVASLRGPALGTLLASTLEQRPLFLPGAPWSGGAAEGTLLASAGCMAPFLGADGLYGQGFPARAASSPPTALDHLGGSDIIRSLTMEGEAGGLASECHDVRKAAETGRCWL